MRLARRVCTALGETYHVGGHEVTSSASIGIAIGPLDNEASETLLKNADLALYRAKEDGRNTFRFFEPAMDAAPQKRRRLETDLRNALRKNQLYLDYQPQFDLVSGKAHRLRGAGALVASERGRNPAHHLHPDRRGNRSHRAARRVDPQDRLRLRHDLAG
jgi:predicted signal transduction protein with EAL and GGDEF domain